MDKKTIIVVGVCVLALLAWQWGVDQVFPPKLKPRPPVTATTNAPATTVMGGDSTTTNVVPEKIAAAPVVPPAPAPGPATPAEREQLVTLANEFLRVDFTTLGGGIRRIELLRHRAGGNGQVMLNEPAAIPALVLTTLPGAGAEASFAVSQPDPRTVVLQRATGDGVTVTKTFTLGNDYTLNAQVVVSGATNGSRPDLTVNIGTARLIEPRETADLLMVGWLAGPKYESGTLKQLKKERPVRREGRIRWGAVKNQFFTQVLTPATNATAMVFDHLALPAPASWKEKEPPQGLTAALDLLPVQVEGEVRTYEFAYYAGPKEYDRLLALQGGQEEIMQFGFWGVISIVLLKSMKFFHGLLPNWGIAIILVTIVIKILFWPIQAKSIKSMKAMQQFQPLMAKLREKFKDDPQRLNAEMMKLYKEHKINPFAGCLPMVVQIPVFFAFYTMLRSAVELRGAGFIWIKDLAQPDTIAQVAGFPLNPLPLAMGASMIWQMKLTPSGGDPKQQQMMYIMPVVFLFICYNMSSGLVLYWTVQQFLSIAQQWWSLRTAQTGGPAAPPSATMKRVA